MNQEILTPEQKLELGFEKLADIQPELRDALDKGDELFRKIAPFALHPYDRRVALEQNPELKIPFYFTQAVQLYRYGKTVGELTAEIRPRYLLTLFKDPEDDEWIDAGYALRMLKVWQPQFDVAEKDAQYNISKLIQIRQSGRKQCSPATGRIIDTTIEISNYNEKGGHVRFINFGSRNSELHKPYIISASRFLDTALDMADKYIADPNVPKAF